MDFVLFPTPTFVHQVQSQTELVRETLCTIPSSDPKLTTLGQPQPRHPINRRNTIQLQHSGSPFQNPRVRNSLQGPTSGESNMSPRSNPNGSHNFYASSAPSSTLALSKQQPSYSRPPVPLFTSNSTENMHSHGGSAMATTSSPKGILSSQYHSPASCDLTCSHLVMVSGNYYDESSVDSLFDYSVFDGKEEFDFQISNFRPTDNTASTQSSSPPQTVSPQDVLLDTISAPPSSTMTNFSTPGTYPTNSPFITTSADPSPLYEQDFLTDEANQWEPLFPTEGDVSNGAMFGNNSIEYEASDVAVPPPMSRNQSSPGRSSRGSHQGRHSSISGVNARKRNNPLPPITVDDPNDSVAVKRARNTAAARKSRARKIERMEELEETIEKLTAERDHWKRIALGGHTEV